MPKKARRKKTRKDTITFEIKGEPRTHVRGRRFGRASTRKAAEGLTVAVGLASLVFAFITTRNLIGSPLALGSATASIFMIILGATLTILGLREADSQVEMGGSTISAVVGLCLIVLVFLTIYGQMGVTPQPENLFWLLVLITIPLFTIRLGVPRIHRLDQASKGIWGSAFVFVGLTGLVFCAWVVHTLIGTSPLPANLVWLLIMTFLSLFMMRQGSPLVTRSGGLAREAWEWALLAAGVGVFARFAILSYNVQQGVLKTMDLAWASILATMWLFLLVWGLKLKRE